MRISDWSSDVCSSDLAPDTVYCDPQVPDGLKGREALRAYLTKLFAETPPMNYVPHETWATHDGYSGRWYCTMSLPDGSKSYMRGFDLGVLKGDEIALNEVHEIGRASCRKKGGTYVLIRRVR